MENKMEIHPVNTRIVCLNYPQLQPSWIFKALSSSLQCCYNHHQPQVIWFPGSVNLPPPRTLKLRGHASHAVQNTATPLMNGFFQTGTYLVFYIPPRIRMVGQSCVLVLNGVESVIRATQNPPKFKAQLIKNSNDEPPDQENHKREISTKEDDNQNLNNQILKDPPSESGLKTSHQECNHIYPLESRTNMMLDFDATDTITMIVEETFIADCEESDSSDDIHKIVRKQLSTNIQPMFAEWKSSGDNLLILLLRPKEKKQAWQFLSACLQISINEMKEKGENEGTSATLQQKRKGITRTKPISSKTNSLLTLKRPDKSQHTKPEEKE